MRVVYPIVISKGDNYFVVSIPDFESGTQGRDLADAIYMARDAIGLLGIDMEDDGKQIPKPHTNPVIKQSESDIVTLVDIDFEEYRQQLELEDEYDLELARKIVAESDGTTYSMGEVEKELGL
jgi:predicted RNase H-like HicB family nuclease